MWKLDELHLLEEVQRLDALRAELLLDLLGGPPVRRDLFEDVPLHGRVHRPEDGHEFSRLADDLDSVHSGRPPYGGDALNNYLNA